MVPVVMRVSFLSFFVMGALMASSEKRYGCHLLTLTRYNFLAFQLVSYVTLSDTLVLFEPSKIPRFQTWYLDLRSSFTWESVLQMKNTTLVSFPH